MPAATQNISSNVDSALKEMKTQKGEVLGDLSNSAPTLVVFLRPFGCIFCMESMKDLGKQRAHIESKGVKICCVHMAAPEVAESYFNDYGLKDIDHVSDVNCAYYESFGLLKGDFKQLYGLKIWLRTIELGVQDVRRLRMKQIGDGFQMPGVFLIHNGGIINEFKHRKTSDRPDYKKLIEITTEA